MKLVIIYSTKSADVCLVKQVDEKFAVQGMQIPYTVKGVPRMPRRLVMSNLQVLVQHCTCIRFAWHIAVSNALKSEENILCLCFKYRTAGYFAYLFLIAVPASGHNFFGAWNR